MRLFTIALLFVLVSLAICQSDHSEHRTLLQVLQCQDRFSMLVDAIRNFPELLQLLKDPSSQLTVFAPDNNAFKKLLSQPSKEELGRTLQYHLVPGIVKLDSKLNRDIFLTLLKEEVLGDHQRLKIEQKNKSWVVNDHNHVLETNIEASNGIIQVLSDVEIPPKDMFYILTEKPTRAAILATALEVTGLIDVIKTTRLTLFAPTNHAFENLPKKERKMLFSEAGRANLTRILKSHAVPALVYLGELEHKETTVNTLEEGVTLTIRKEKKGFSVNKVQVTLNDVFASNGVVSFLQDVIDPNKKPEHISPRFKAIVAHELDNQVSVLKSLQGWLIAILRPFNLQGCIQEEEQ